MHKALCLSTSYPTPFNPVSGSFVHNLYSHLAKLDWKIQVVTPAAPGVDHPFTADGIEIIPARYFLSPYQRVAHASGGVMHAIRQNPLYVLLVPMMLISLFIYTWRHSKEADVIHANWSICGVIAIFVGLIRNIPVITTLRGSDTHHLKKATLKRIALKFVVSLSARTTAVSRSIISSIPIELQKASQNIIAIQNGISDSFLSGKEAALDFTGHNPLNIVAIGNLTKNKDFDCLLRAIQNHRSSQPHIQTHTRIIGTGPELPNLKEFIGVNKLEECVQLVGALPPEEIPALLKTAHVFVICSHNEGLSNVLLEAMASGSAVVATNIAPNRELLSESNSLLFPAGNSEQLANAIGHLANSSPTVHRLGQNARRSLQQSGATWQACAGQYCDVFLSTLKR